MSREVRYTDDVKNESEINDVQAGIMRELFRKDDLRFSEINVNKILSDQFSYHLRQLVKYGLIEKSPDSTYRLSVIGRSRAIMLNSNKAGFIEQGFLAVRIVLDKTEGGQRYFLMQQRTVVPYKGTYATPGDKILYGEDVARSAQRVMQEQTGLTCSVALKGVTHIKDQYLDAVVQDKYFFVFAGSDPRGELQPSCKKGNNLWLTRQEIEQSGLSIQGGLDILDMVDNSTLEFDERTLAINTY
jgi:ADP-ribose pyrophosphatase YjhB (NUDIX family)